MNECTEASDEIEKRFGDLITIVPWKTLFIGDPIFFAQFQVLGETLRTNTTITQLIVRSNKLRNVCN